MGSGIFGESLLARRTAIIEHIETGWEAPPGCRPVAVSRWLLPLALECCAGIAEMPSVDAHQRNTHKQYAVRTKNTVNDLSIPDTLDWSTCTVRAYGALIPYDKLRGPYALVNTI